MKTTITVPAMGESVSEAVLIRWHKKEGELVKESEPVCELETDKANVDAPSQATGVIRHLVKEGTTVRIGQAIAEVDTDAKPSASTSAPAATASPAPAPATPAPASRAAADSVPAVAAPPARATPAPAAAGAAAPSGPSVPAGGGAHPADEDLTPSIRRMIAEHGLAPEAVTGTGPAGRITREDVARAIADTQAPRAADVEPATAAPVVQSGAGASSTSGDGVHRTPMSKIRRKIAERLVQAQQTAAILTTFNEIDMQAVMDLRSRHKEKFEKLHGIGLGFMSFFARAVAIACREFPRVNGQIEGDDIITHDFLHLGIAVSTERGLAVPVLRHAEQMSFAKIESEIKRLALATRDGKLGLNELSGGTFTITNGGVFGSLLSTPIINPPQSAILGMHAITKRAVVVNDQIVVRPMMFVALSYDHRLIDGRESVSFLVRLKELIEDPSRMMLEV